MRMSRDFTREQVIDAITGTGGIVSAIAKRLGCAWFTAQVYIQKWASTQRAFDDEREQFLDACESVLEKNIQLAMQAQKKGEIVDTSDVKWTLARLGKKRGYVERVETAQVGKVEFVVTYDDKDDTDPDPPETPSL